jgi:hypothetical protein
MGDYKVWYRAEAKQKSQQSGDLSVGPGKVKFAGKKDTFEFAPPVTVGRQSVGMTNWIVVQYTDNGEAKSAYFVDRRMLGWGGVLGGNQKLAEDLGSV